MNSIEYTKRVLLGVLVPPESARNPEMALKRKMINDVYELKADGLALNYIARSLGISQAQVSYILKAGSVEKALRALYA